jgi:hypothetical protein
MTEKGMELVEISPELQAAMAERAAALQADFVARVPEAGDIIEQFKATQ